MSDTGLDIGQLARALWGEPNRRLSRRDELRFGEHGSKSVDLRNRTWFDHETREGGSFRDLREKVNGNTREFDSSIVAVYDYHDAHGALVFQVVRKAPKTFRQRRPDGAGGWIWNLKGVERVLYRLPELLASSPDAVVHVVEGEKDADTLHRAGLVATTNPGGAGKWQRSMSEFLRGRDVVILPDNDPQSRNADGRLLFHPDGRPVLTGQDHATSVAGHLRGIARSVAIVALPGLPPKGDVSDWFAAGGTAEKLVQFIAVEPKQDRPAAQTLAPAAAVADWRSALLCNGRGETLPVLANALTGLRQAPELVGTFIHDEMSGQTLMTRGIPDARTAPVTEPRPLQDQDVTGTREWLQRNGNSRLGKEVA